MPNELNEHTFAAGDVLYDTTAPLDQAFFVLSGEVVLTAQLNAREVSLTLGANHFVGDAAVAIADKGQADTPRYHAKAVALNEVTAVVVSIGQLQDELAAASPLVRAWVASFTHRMLAVTQQLSTAQPLPDVVE